VTGAASAGALARASALCELGRFQDAARHASEYLQTDPHNAYALCLLARARLGSDDAPGALTATQAAIAADPGSEWAFRIASIALQRLDQPQEAVRMARRAVEVAPHLASCHARLAQALANPGTDLAGARRAADRAVQLDPHLVEAHLAVGAVAMADGRSAAARAAYKRALAIDPDSAAAHNDLARTHMRRRRIGNAAGLADAAGGFATALLSDPNMRVSRRNLELVLHLFLARLAYYVFVTAFIGYRLTVGTSLPRWALWTPAAALSLPAFFAARFTLGLPPTLRQYLKRSLRHQPLRGIAMAALGLAAALLVLGALAPATQTAGFLCAAILSLAARLALYRQGKRDGFTTPRKRRHKR
jgi:tetratricopeptide (TPR) repeat protein